MPQPARRSQRRQSTRTSTNRQMRSTPIPRQVVSRPVPEKVDYSEDYRFVQRDLQWIAIWSVLLFAGMFAYFFISHAIS